MDRERALSEEPSRPDWDGAAAADPSLLAQGWTARFVTDRRRSPEIVELYRRVGFEVQTVPLKAADLPEGCSDCRLLSLLEFSLIYTRPSPVAPSDQT